jgi:sec-independent protein translocase protein TatA
LSPTPTTLAFLNVGFAEMVVLFIVALLVFGERLPDTLRSVGRGYARFRRQLQDATRPVREEIARIEREATRDVSAPLLRGSGYPSEPPRPPGAPAGEAPETPGTTTSTPPAPPPSYTPPASAVGDEPPTP